MPKVPSRWRASFNNLAAGTPSVRTRLKRTHWPQEKNSPRGFSRIKTKLPLRTSINNKECTLKPIIQTKNKKMRGKKTRIRTSSRTMTIKSKKMKNIKGSKKSKLS